MSLDFSQTVAAIVLVAAKTRLQQQDAIVCRVFHPDGRDYFFNISVSPEVTVSQYLQSLRAVGLSKANVGQQPDLTIIFAPTHVAHELVVSRRISPASTIHVPLDDASKPAGPPRFYDVGQENEWAAGRFTAAHDALSLASDGAMLSELSVVSPPERDTLLKWAVAPPSTRCEDHTFSAMIHEYFERVAEENPEYLAIHSTDARGTVTYGELNQWANALATHLVQKLGVRSGDLVLLFFDKGVEMLVAIMAILKASAAYVPLDVRHPSTRIRSIHRTTSAKLCLTTESRRDAISAHIDTAFVSVDEFLRCSDGSVSRLPPSSTTNGEDLCYVMFTSGSTGEPKGVMVTHSSVVSSVINGPESNQQLRRQGQSLRTLMFSNYAFDYSVWDIFLTLSSGGTLCIPSESEMLNDLTGTMRSMAITFLETTPTVLSLVDPAEVPSLTTVYSSGEALTPAVSQTFLRYHPRIKLYNGGAPTEATVMVVFTPIVPFSPPGIFGRPFGANRLYILDEHKHLCPVGVPGRLWVGGPQVSRGYLGRDDLTMKAYAPDPFHGDGGRMYNTNDLCVWAPDKGGEGSEGFALFYIGRADTQVKIRGQRIETGEIEAVLGGVEGVKVSSVVKRVRMGAEELIAFVELDKDAVEDTVLRNANAAMSQRLPRYMLPSATIPLSALPVTTNGKLDRARLEQIALEAKKSTSAHGNGKSNGVYLDNRHTNGVHLEQTVSPIEQVIRDAWAMALHRPASSISLDVDFYSSGGDSISCIRVTAACRSAGYPLTIMDFAEAPTISAQARLVELRSRIPLPEPYRPFELLVGAQYRQAIEQEMISYGYRIDDIEDAYPSPPPVAGLISLAAGSPLSYFAQYSYCAQTNFDPIIMEAAWRLLLKRHEVLRSVFVVAPPPHNDIVQVVLSDRTSPLCWTHSVLPDEIQRDAAVTAYLKQAPGFALGKCPTHSSTVVFEFHHAQYDGWSFPHLLRDVQIAYQICSGSLTGWVDSPTPYSHFSRWSLHQDPEKALAFWRSQLADVPIPSFPKVPTFNVRKKAVTDQSSIRVFSMGQQLAGFCAAQRVTMSSCVRAAVALTLGLHDNTSDVLFGVVTSGRTGDIPGGVESIFGSCISTIPCRVRLPPDHSLESIVQAVHAHSIESLPYQFVGLNQILAAADFEGEIFRVLLTIENIDGLYESEHEFLGQNTRGHLLEMNYPLAISFQYDSESLDLADLDWIQEHLFSALSALIEHPKLSIADSNFLSAKEEQFVLEIGVGSTPDVHIASKYFHCMVDDAAARVPTHIALEHTGGETMTYEALVRLANQAAHGLQARGVRPEVCVPVLFDKNRNQIQAVVAILAVLKSGGAFVPLDSSWPVDRLASCTPQVVHSIPAPFVTVEQLALRRPTTPPSTPDLGMDSLFYVMKPKGVLVEHSNASAFRVHCIPTCKRAPVFALQPWSFGQGLADLLLALPIGGTVVLANMEEMLLDLTATLNSCKADYTTMVCGGEKLPAQLVRRWATKLEYGPTEFTIHGLSVSFKHNKYVPGVIGRALGSTESMRPVPVGAVGELMLSGNHVVGDIWTCRRNGGCLHSDPFHPGQRMYKSGDLARFRSDGRIEYLGRKEGGHVKRRGLRIDVAEIEATLMTARETLAVVEVLPVDGQPHLVAFVAHSLAPAGAAQVALSSDLLACQPWIKTLSDACIRILAPHSSSFGAKPVRLPETVLERKLHTIWSKLSAKNHIYSLNAVRVVARLRNRDCHLTIQEFYGSSTIAALAEFLESSGPPVLGLAFPVQKDMGDGLKPALWLFHCAQGVGREYMNLPSLERDVYAISNPSKNRMSLEANFPTLDRYIDHYLPLLPPNEPIYLGGFSSGGLLGILMAARRRVILFDTFSTQGWKLRGFQADAGPLELQRLSHRHTSLLIQHFVEPEIDFPVLLLRAGAVQTRTKTSPWQVHEGGNEELNFFTPNPFFEIQTIPGAAHSDMVAYQDNYATPAVQKVAEHIRRWCRSLD
ncbi:hypothetical protein K438DRAFT_1868307 [Mycena galopus ATCC 62051]|nr:hypothetical protein K438DRAFT_1868307 [Mycena galopus ATCC 62051]